MKLDQIYDRYNTFIVGVSGGKDSTATALWAIDNLPREKIKFVHHLTGASWPETDEYLLYLQNKLDIKIETVSAGDRPIIHTRTILNITKDLEACTNLFDMVHIRGHWPNWRIRWCTKNLKGYPVRLYAQEFDRPLLISGVRREESYKRATLHDYDPLDARWKGITRYKCHWYYPILSWSLANVFEYLNLHGVKKNPIYKYVSRIGCWCCPCDCSNQNVLQFCKQHPELAKRWIDLEREIGMRWRNDISLASLYERAQQQLCLF